MIRLPGIRDRAETLVVILMVGCVGVPIPRAVAADVPPTVDFRREIRPILSDACFDCHGPDPKARKANLRLDVADGGIFEDRDGARVVMPGKPEESELILRITSTEPDEKMPPPKHHRQLKTKEVESLSRWVAEGAKWQDHWSLVPPERPPLPAVKEDSWARNDIDTFILARLEKEGLRPSPEADRGTLIRRVTLDLTGLPPTPEEVDAFHADPSPDAYERLVDRLLRSPHYGERMALDWLDAARYADTNGYQVDRDREMWPWRDWVVDAFNCNMPFDQFTIEQLAGDLLPNPSLAQRIATGLHRNNMLNEEGGILPEEFLAEYVSDRVEATSTIWLGLTVGCAKCHDHKFDPISQKDFYGLYAFFHNVPESGLGNFAGESRRSAPPLLMIPTPEQQRTLDRQSVAIAEVEKQLADLGPRLASEQATWEETLGSEDAAGWVVLEPSALRSKGGTSLREQPDRTIVAEGPNPPSETYDLEATTDLMHITALRLEALPDERLPDKGPGRAANGNFVLTGLRLSTAAGPVKFKSASADFSQAKFPVTSAIDDKPQTGWAVHPEIGRPHTAVFEVEKPAEVSGILPLAITLDFQSSSAQHLLGKFRLSVTDVKDPSRIRPLPSPVAQILDVAADKRDERQKAELAKYFREKVSPTTKPFNDRLAGLRKDRTELEKQIPTMMVMAELPEPRETSVLIRGQYDKKGEKVGPATLTSLPPLPPRRPAQPPRAGSMARRSPQPADRPSDGQPLLASVLRQRAGPDLGGFRFSR